MFGCVFFPVFFFLSIFVPGKIPGGWLLLVGFVAILDGFLVSLIAGKREVFHCTIVSIILILFYAVRHFPYWESLNNLIVLLIGGLALFILLVFGGYMRALLYRVVRGSSRIAGN